MQRGAILVFLIFSMFVTAFGAPKSAERKVEPSSKNWETEIGAFEAHDTTNPPPRNGILFIGSSSIRLWKTLETDFPGHAVINRGFGGSQLIDSVFYADRIVIPYAPRQIFLYAGGNDVNAGKTPEEVFNDFQLFVETVRKKLPHVEISYISIAPNPARWSQIERVRAANKLIRSYIRWKNRLHFIDVHSQMLNEQGEPKEGIYLEDKLHMNDKGYQIWKKIIGPKLAEK